MQIYLGTTGESWNKKVVEPCAHIVKEFLSGSATSTGTTACNISGSPGTSSKELWVQFICEVCYDMNVLTIK